MSLATARSTRPSPSMSKGATPSALATGPRSGVRTWMPASSLTSTNRPPSLRSRTQSEPPNAVGRAVGPAPPRELEALHHVDLGRPGDVVAEERSRSPSLSMSKNAAPVSQPSRPGRGRLGHVHELPLAVVAEEMAAAEGGDEEVGVAVVVVVAHGDAHAVEGLVETGLLRSRPRSGPCRRCDRGPGSGPGLIACPGQGHELTKKRSWSPSLS